MRLPFSCPLPRALFLICQSLSSPARKPSLEKAASSPASPHFKLLKAIREPKRQALGHLTFTKTSTELT